MVFHSAVNKKTVERTISTRSTAITSGSDRNKNPVAPNNTQETNTATEDRRMADHQITLLKIPVQDPSEILNWVPVQVPVQDHASESSGSLNRFLEGSGEAPMKKTVQVFSILGNSSPGPTRTQLEIRKYRKLHLFCIDMT